jgi:hypothetical protein
MRNPSSSDGLPVEDIAVIGVLALALYYFVWPAMLKNALTGVAAAGAGAVGDAAGATIGGAVGSATIPPGYYAPLSPAAGVIGTTMGVSGLSGVRGRWAA